MSWRTVASSDPANPTSYTLFYAMMYTSHDVVQHWEPVEGCTNVTSTDCNVRALFKDDDDFRGFQRFRIDYITNGSVSCRGRKFQRDPLKSVKLSAPPITHIEATSEEISFRLIYPSDNHYPGLDLQLLRQFVNHKYHVSIRQYSTNATVKNYAIKHDLSAIQRIYDLLPATQYLIIVRSAVYPPVVWGPSASMAVVQTLEKPPSIGPSNLELVNSSFSCSAPDQREIIITWKGVDEEYWNGELLFYEVRAVLWESQETFTSRLVNTSSTMVSLKGLSRWEKFDVVVFANNSAGGTRNNIPLQLKSHVVDERGSQPQSVTVSRERKSRSVIKWQPPAQYDECIMGYIITWTDGQGAEHHAIEVGNKWLGVIGHVTKARVTPLLRKDYRNEQTGVALMYIGDKAHGGSGFNLWFLLLIGVLVFILVVTMLIVAKWKYIKLRWLKPQFKDGFNLEHNKVLKPAFDRQVSYEPCLRHEKEVFDTPSPGVHNLQELPPWSPDFERSPRYEHQVPLLHRGLPVVDDIDEVDLPPETEDAVFEANAVHSSKNRGSETGSKSDSAIDTLSASDVEYDDIAAPVAPSDSGYITHNNLQDHLHATAHIDDYTRTGVSGYVPLSSAVGSSIESDRNVTSNPNTPSDDYVTEQIDTYTVAGVSDQPSTHNSPTGPGRAIREDIDPTPYDPHNPTEPKVGRGTPSRPSLHPGKAQMVSSPYVSHSEVMQPSSWSSDRSGDDIADYCKQTIAHTPTNNGQKTLQESALKSDKQEPGEKLGQEVSSSTTDEDIKTLQRERVNVLPVSEEVV
ncbi:uncharacterized protein LOC135155609 [Lytechinus pictus]|uniref:uncharacterized protein LOC135155609 n=1 Tax=Lytechinus pictus TaxID=7653 RepID=UPI0030B9FCF5